MYCAWVSFCLCLFVDLNELKPAENHVGDTTRGLTTQSSEPMLKGTSGVTVESWIELTRGSGKACTFSFYKKGCVMVCFSDTAIRLSVN